MRRKGMALIAALLLLCGMAACDEEPGALSEQDLSLAIGAAAYNLRQDAGPLLDSLGERQDFTQRISCLYVGMDKSFVYPGIRIDTVPAGEEGRDVIEMIALTDATYSTTRGVRVGDTLEAVREAYGEPHADDGYYMMYYLSGDASDLASPRIEFQVEGGAVVAVFLLSPSY